MIEFPGNVTLLGSELLVSIFLFLILFFLLAFAHSFFLALEKQLQTLEAAVARLALTANATGRTALDRVNNINQILPDISRAGMGYGAALAFNAVRIHSGVDYSRFDVCERGLEREVEHSVEDMKEAGTDLADSFNHDLPIRHRIG